MLFIYSIFVENKLLMRKTAKLSLVLILFFVANYIDAQTVVKNDTIAGVPLTMSMDSRVNELLERAEENCDRIAGTGNVYDGGETEVSTKKPTIKTPAKPLSNAEICRQNPRIMGYKIQLAVVKSNEEAKEVGMYFRRRFPNMKVEIDASLRPNYKVMAGSYFTKQSANEDLKKIKPYFKSAIPVQYRVFCVEAK